MLSAHDARVLIDCSSLKISINILVVLPLNVKDVIKLAKYLAREVKLEQGITSPYEAIRLLSDYIRMSKQIGHKYEKFPKSLKKVHDITAMNYKVVEDEMKNEAFKKIIAEETYNYLAYKKDNYHIIIPEDVRSVVLEGKNLSHCVASYVNDIIIRKCQIVFMRLKNFTDQSFITIEVRNKVVRQAKGSHNRPTIAEEDAFIEKWANAK